MPSSSDDNLPSPLWYSYSMQLCLYAEADVPGQQRDSGQGGDDRHLPQAYQVGSYSFF